MFRNNRQKSDQAGFTLIEIAIVLFIMGLMMMLALPYLGSLGGAQLRSQSRRLAGRATYLFDEATAQKIVLRLTFNLDRNSYSVSRLDPFAVPPVFKPDPELAGETVYMPPAV